MRSGASGSAGLSVGFTLVGRGVPRPVPSILLDGRAGHPQDVAEVDDGQAGAFLAEWLEVRSTSLRPASVRAYRTHLGYLIDQLGTVKLADLGPGHVAACQTALLARLSPTTVRG